MRIRVFQLLVKSHSSGVLPVFSTSVSLEHFPVALRRLSYRFRVHLAMASFRCCAMRRPHGRRSETARMARTPLLSSYRNWLAQDSSAEAALKAFNILPSDCFFMSSKVSRR